ncbi:YesL family protein [Gracilibacillus alcaliphilus]|uniref:YesL family protein n=1 Tax=Gracilibacillus alcaliphilus TaxID=1401441 RepID=UPI001956FB1B|nr:DUF624 domain-containing protein [Gracilibacillus alcaliphilus]MBM7676388.1 putative membrane protein YesL [Gracilibacillus alcaliphilus]
MELEGLTGRVYKITDWFMLIVVTNVLWFLFNLPIAYLAFMLLVVDSTRDMIAFSIYIMVLLPVFFFPATTAMFAVLRNRIMFPNDDRGIFTYFLKSYKANYIRSFLGGVLFTVLWTVWIVDYFFFVNRISELFLYLFLFIGFLLIVMTIHFFSVTVHMHSKLLEAVKNAVIITIANPLLTLIIGIVTIVVIYISFQITTFFIPFFLGSFIAYIAFNRFYHFVNKMMDDVIIQPNEDNH